MSVVCHREPVELVVVDEAHVHPIRWICSLLEGRTRERPRFRAVQATTYYVGGQFELCAGRYAPSAPSDKLDAMSHEALPRILA